jgi:acetolactate synthase-1/2/3 large subunit
MNRSDELVAASVAAGVDVCFANPGTTEMPLVDAIRRSDGMRPVLVLFEGVASGAADGYARISGKPASVLLHLGPGLGNATANLHNARRAQSPVVAWVGDHPDWLVDHDPPLTSDIEAIARGTSRWVQRVQSAETMGTIAREAVQAALGPESGVATLVIPMDFQEAVVPDGAATASDAAPLAPEFVALDSSDVDALAGKLRGASSPLILLGGPGTATDCVAAGASIAESVGGLLLLERFPRYLRRAPGLPAPARLQYLPMMARAQLMKHDLVVAIGVEPPSCFFGYAGERPELTAEGAELLQPCLGGQDPSALLAALVEAIGASGSPSQVAGKSEPFVRSGALAADSACAVLASLLPEDAIVVDEGITSSIPLYPTLEGAAPHHYLACKGGSIGFGTPVSTGAAVAAPGRRVVTWVGDGSAAYTLQSLWTQAREGLDVTTLVLVNDRYAILQLELARGGFPIEEQSLDLTDLGRPTIDWVKLAQGFGVPAEAVTDTDGLHDALGRSFATPGPTLITIPVE